MNTDSIKNKKDLRKNIIITFIALIILLVFEYHYTNTMEDWIISAVISVILMSFIFLLDLKTFFKIDFHVQSFLVAFIFYLWFYTINYFLTTPLPTSISIATVIGGYLGAYARRKTNHITFTFKKFAALALALIIMYSSLLYLLDDSLLGTSKTQRDVKKYLIEEKHYKKSEIKDIFFIHKKGTYSSVLVCFKDEPNTEYEYIIKDKKVVQYSTTSYELIKPTHNHLENENVIIIQ